MVNVNVGIVMTEKLSWMISISSGLQAGDSKKRIGN
jgi:hypothetical protein